MLHISDDSVLLPPRATVLVEVTCEGLQDTDAVAERNVSLLLLQVVRAAQSFVQVRDGQSWILVTNFSYEYRHLFRCTAMGYGDLVADITDCFTSDEMLTGDSSFGHINVNSKLLVKRKAAVHDLLTEFNSCFASSSKVCQMPLTKHPVITDDETHPPRQQPDRISAKECEAIQPEVKKMLDDGVIQPSCSTGSLLVVLAKKTEHSTFMSITGS